jgi:hypothetical protein
MKLTKRHDPNRRLWNKPGVPHTDWRQVDQTDLREQGARDETEYATCEMCARPGIRFVCEMVHSDHPIPLKVGRGCAAKMTTKKINRVVDGLPLRENV